MYINQRTITSRAHELFTQEQKKIGLNALDIKRIILPGGVHTVPYGHFEYDES